MTGDPMTQPAGAPDQKARVLEWLQSEPEGLTQLQALQHLAVARLAAIVHRLKGDGHAIVTELVEMPTRYGPAQVARYHLAPRAAVVGPCPVKLYEPDLALRDGAPTECDGNVPPGCTLEVRDFDQAVRPPLDFDRLRREAGLE